MSVNIQSKHSTTAGAVPTPADILPGELALDIAEGKLYYENSADGTVHVLAQELYMSPDATPPANPKTTAFWWVTDFEVLRVFNDPNWFDVAVSKTSGGVYKGHITVRDSGDTVDVLKTTDDGVETRKLTATGAIVLTAGQIVRAAATVGGTANVITGTFTVPVTSLAYPLIVMFNPTGDSTSTTPTFQADATAATTIVRASGALVAGDIKSGRPAIMVYNGTNYVLINPATSTTRRASPATQAYAEDVTRTFAHGFGTAPAFVQVYLECTVGEYGYSPGERLLIDKTAHTPGTSPLGITVKVDATNVYVVIGVNGMNILDYGSRVARYPEAGGGTWTIGVIAFA